MLEGLSPKPDKRNRCKVRDTILDLEPQDAQLLESYLADTENWSANALSNGLASRGLKLSVGVIIRHRNGHCHC
jgi:hypothetical protein